MVPEEGAYALRLDGRALRTPAKAALLVPTRAMAEAMAEEWRAVGEAVDPRAMPVTRAANAALDKVAPERGAVVAELASYGDSDLLCYRAEAPRAWSSDRPRPGIRCSTGRQDRSARGSCPSRG